MQAARCAESRQQLALHLPVGNVPGFRLSTRVPFLKSIGPGAQIGGPRTEAMSDGSRWSRSCEAVFRSAVSDLVWHDPGDVGAIVLGDQTVPALPRLYAPSVHIIFRAL